MCLVSPNLSVVYLSVGIQTKPVNRQRSKKEIEAKEQLTLGQRKRILMKKDTWPWEQSVPAISLCSGLPAAWVSVESAGDCLAGKGLGYTNPCYDLLSPTESKAERKLCKSDPLESTLGRKSTRQGA